MGVPRQDRPLSLGGLDGSFDNHMRKALLFFFLYTFSTRGSHKLREVVYIVEDRVSQVVCRISRAHSSNPASYRLRTSNSKCLGWEVFQISEFFQTLKYLCIRGKISCGSSTSLNMKFMHASCMPCNTAQMHASYTPYTHSLEVYLYNILHHWRHKTKFMYIKPSGSKGVKLSPTYG